MGSRGGRKKKKKRDKDGELGSNIKSHGIEKETFPTSSSYESSIESLTTSREDLLTEILHADKTIDGMTATQPFQVETSEEHNFLGFGQSRKRKLDKLTDKRTPTLDTSGNLDNVLNNKQPENIDYVRFLYLQTVDSNQVLKKINPFVLRLAIENITGGPIKTARYCRSGSLLLETCNKIQTRRLLQAKSIINGTIPIEVTVAKNLNTCQGTILAPELAGLKDEELLNYLRSENVVHVRRINRGKEKNPTNILILTFGGTELPDRIYCGYLTYKIRIFYPNPLRCYQCQKFGHGSKNCRSSTACGFCAESHNTELCPRNCEPKCFNCKDSHPAYSRNCIHFLRETEIIKIKVDQKTTFENARRLFKQQCENIQSRVSITKETYAATVNKNREIGSRKDNIDTPQVETSVMENSTIPLKHNNHPSNSTIHIEKNKIVSLITEIGQLMIQKTNEIEISENIPVILSRLNMSSISLTKDDAYKLLFGDINSVANL